MHLVLALQGETKLWVGGIEFGGVVKLATQPRRRQGLNRKSQSLLAILVEALSACEGGVFRWRLLLAVFGGEWI